MKHTGKYIFILLLALFAAGVCPVRAQEQIKVVATLSTFADLVAQVGGDRVQVQSIASPAFDPHHIEPKPSDVLRTKRSELFVHAGIDLEPWRDPLINASGRADLRQGGKASLDLSSGVTLLNAPSAGVGRAQGDIHLYGNPHYWLAPANGQQMLRTIEARLSELRPESRAYFAQRRAEYAQRLDKKTAEWRALLAPYHGRELLGYHDSWVYLVDFLGLQMRHFIEPQPGIPPSPRHIQELQELMRGNTLRVIVQESFYPSEAAESLAKASGAKLLLLCQNVGQLPECSEYLELLEYNIRAIAAALAQ